jgi:hypothetical protein
MEPGGDPIDGLVTFGAPPLEGHEKASVAQFVECDRELGVVAELLVLRAGQKMAALQLAKQLDGERRQGLDRVDCGVERPTLG